MGERGRLLKVIKVRVGDYEKRGKEGKVMGKHEGKRHLLGTGEISDRSNEGKGR